MSANSIRKPKLDPYSLLEKRMDELSEKFSEMEERTKKSFENLQEYIVLLTEIIYCDVSLLTRINRFPRQGKISNFDAFVSDMHERDKALRLLKATGIRIPEGLDFACDIMDTLFTHAHHWRIPFETIASYVIEKFGKREAKRLVKKETLLDFYGKEVIPIWEKVLEE